MAYGILLESANGNLQISSETANIGIIVLDAVASSSTVTFDPAKEVIFAKPASTSYTDQKVHLSMPTGYSSGSATFTFEERNFTSGGTNATVNMNYIKCKWAEEFTAGTSGYGIQIYNSNNDLAYDSTLYQDNGGFNITGFRNLAEVTGYGSTTTSSLITTDTSSYVDFIVTGSNQPGEYQFSKVTGSVGIYWRHIWILPVINTVLFFNNSTPILIGEGGSV